jgi:hypothetical protein
MHRGDVAGGFAEAPAQGGEGGAILGIDEAGEVRGEGADPCGTGPRWC